MSRRSTMSTKPKPGEPFSRGRQMALAEKGIYNNPYSHNSGNYHTWREGWREGDRLRRLGR